MIYIYIYTVQYLCNNKSYIAVFLNRRAAARYRTLASIIPGPRLIEKRIYRAAVCQRLRTTPELGIQKCFKGHVSVLHGCNPRHAEAVSEIRVRI
jgi:hypothetical protein